MAVSDLSQTQRRFRGIAPPEVVQAIGEKLGRYVGFLIPVKGIYVLTSSPSMINIPFRDIDNKTKLDKGAIEIVLLNLAFTTARRNIRMQERLEMPSDRAGRNLILMPESLFLQLAHKSAWNQFRILRSVDDVVPS